MRYGAVRCGILNRVPSESVMYIYIYFKVYIYVTALLLLLQLWKAPVAMLILAINWPFPPFPSEGGRSCVRGILTGKRGSFISKTNINTSFKEANVLLYRVPVPTAEELFLVAGETRLR